MFHLRFTPYDISGYTFDFLDKYESYILALEMFDDEGNELKHYHVLVDTNYGHKSLRDDAKASLKIPKSGKGQNNKYYALQSDWNDPSYICKYDDVLKYKGFTEKQILDYAIAGKKKYLDKRLEKKLNVVAKEKQPPKVPYQQLVIADAASDWFAYKRKCKEDDDIIVPATICEFVCNAMRKHGKGINPYLVKEIGYAVLYDDLDFKDVILKKVQSGF